MRPTLAAIALTSLAACATSTPYALSGSASATRSATRRVSSGAPTTSPGRNEPAPSGAEFERGVASFYSDSLAGNHTANGERYDPSELTAAHRTLAFGTRVLVEREDGGGAVEVCVNDRGPFVAGRIVDLSRAAAQTLGMIRAGIVRVRLRVTRPSTRRRCE